MNRVPKAVYTKEFREEAVKLALTEGVGVSEAARRLSIPMKSLANWVRAAKARPQISVSGKMAYYDKSVAGRLLTFQSSRGLNEPAHSSPEPSAWQAAAVCSGIVQGSTGRTREKLARSCSRRVSASRSTVVQTVASLSKNGRSSMMVI